MTMPLLATMNAILLLTTAYLLFRSAGVTDAKTTSDSETLREEYRRVAAVSRDQAAASAQLTQALQRIEALERTERQRCYQTEELAAARQLIGRGADNQTVIAETTLNATEVGLLATLSQPGSSALHMRN